MTSQAAHPLILESAQDRRGALAWANIQLVVSLTTSRPLAVRYSSAGVPGRLSLRQESPFTPTQGALISAVQRSREWVRHTHVPADHFDIDIINWAHWFHTRAEESRGRRDSHGRYDRQASITNDKELRRLPALDLMCLAFREFIQLRAPTYGYEPLRHFPWPGGKTMAIMISHDIDHALRSSPAAAGRKVGASILALANGQRGTARRRLSDAKGLITKKTAGPYWLMTTMSRLEAERDFVATYFVLPHRAKHVREGARRVRRYDVRQRDVRTMLSGIALNGGELALHTTYDAHQRVDGIADDLKVLRSACPQDVAIAGARSHYLILEGETLPRTAEAGLEWDATVGWASGWGFRAGTTFPYALDTAPDMALRLWEVGLHLMDVAVERAEFVDNLGRLLATVRETGGAASLLIHPNPYGDTTAEEHLVFYRRALDTVGQYAPEAWVTTVSDVIAAARSHADIVAPGLL